MAKRLEKELLEINSCLENCSAGLKKITYTNGMELY